MVQKSFFVKDQSELYHIVTETEASKEYKNARSILAIVYACGISKEITSEYIGIIHDRLNKTKTAGISVIKSRKSWEDKGFTLSFCFFDKSDVRVFSFSADEYTDETVIEKMSEFIKKTGNVKLVFSFPTGLHNDFTKVLENVSAVDENVSFFGALAATREYYNPEAYSSGERGLEIGGSNRFIQFDEDTDTVSAFSIADSLVESGYVFAAISGEELSVGVRYVLGWKKLGRELNITGRASDTEFGNACITEIDNMPAVQIYKKYLDVDADEYFMDNVCEFPFLVQRGDSLIARVPSYIGNNGELYFAGDIRNDDQVTLSYAIPIELIRQTETASHDLKKMEPEAVFSTICLNRYHFLNDLEGKELDAISGISENMVFAYGGSEIFKGHNYGGVLNSALATIVLKEGEFKEHSDEVLTRAEETRRGTIPFSERLITIIERTNDELEIAKEEAIAASKSKSAFLSNMSHEIRTPINAILGMNEMILRESREDSILEYAENIKSSSNNLLGIINDILDFSKIEVGKMNIVPVEYELSSVLNDLVTMIKKRAEDKGLTIRVNIDPRIPHILYGDEIRIKQIVTNILTNAVKYTEEGGIVLAVNCCKETDENGSCVDSNGRCAGNENVTLEFSVEDTGIGIKEEDIDKLFNSFERVDEKRNRTIEGTGLGMSITENLLELMGSRLKVESEYGVGSRFYFHLTQKIVDYTPIGNFEEALKRSLNTRTEYHEKFTAPDAHILVVDDTQMNLTVIENLLKQTKIKIDTATSGAEALLMTDKKKYDIIFLDHRMPEMDGIECLDIMKADKTGPNADTPVIALTANAVSGAREMYLDAGFNDYLTKPIDSDALETMIALLLPKDLLQEPEENMTEQTDIPEWIEDLPFIDPDMGLRNCGSAEAYLQALKAYKDAAFDMQSAISSAVESEDISAYTIKVHALKSSSRIIGAERIGVLAEKLEEAGNNNDTEKIERYTKQLLSYHSSLAYMLKENMEAEEDAGNKPVISEEKLLEAYQAIHEMSEMFDHDTVGMILKSLEEYRIPENYKARHDDLLKAYRNTDWDNIVRLTER